MSLNKLIRVPVIRLREFDVFYFTIRGACSKGGKRGFAYSRTAPASFVDGVVRSGCYCVASVLLLARAASASIPPRALPRETSG